MKRRMFEALLGSVREAGSILRGQRKPSRLVVIRSTGVPVIRNRSSAIRSGKPRGKQS